MLRRLSLAVLFCLAAWVLVERTSAHTARGGVTAAADSALSLVAADAAGTTDAAAVDIGTTIGPNVATPPIDTHPPEAHWEALLPLGIGGGNGSSRDREHQPQALAGDLPGVSSRVPWPAGRGVDAERHAARFRSPHLLHTPLLI